MSGQVQSINPGKVKTGTSLRTETKTIAENGVTETITTRIITDHFTDGTSSTRRETETTREEELLPSGGGGGVPRLSNGNAANFVVNSGGMMTRSGGGSSPQVPTYNAIPPPIPPPQQQQNTVRTSILAEGMTQSYNNVNNRVGTPTPPLPDPRNDEIFVEEAFRCHNKYRAKHGVPLLMVSRDLCRAAQSWADALAVKGSMENSHFGYGENIYWSSGPGHAMKGDVPVEYWYHEESHFDWGKMDFQKSTGSFTQIIWKESKQFGIAKSSGKAGTFVVAFYIPPGNVVGKFQDNINQVVGGGSSF